MFTTLGVVEVVPSLDGLPSDSPLAGIARRRFAGKTLLEWVVRRVTDADHLQQVVVTAGPDILSRSLAESTPPDARVLHCESKDPLGRLAAVARKFPCRGIVRLAVSDPFVDPILIDRLITSVAGEDDCDYACFVLGDGRPAHESRMGIFADWCRSDAILKADRLARSASDRAEPMQFICSRPKVFNIKHVPVPARLDRGDLRLAIRDEEDWENVETILEALGPESLDWQFITSLIDRHPNICQRMAEHNRAEFSGQRMLV
ncbi:MAG: NTP transferase domain-containing protein [Planctomycetales bacterium]|nr:NTP transferase domain-containing protein [Planctomycetales bacterium]